MRLFMGRLKFFFCKKEYFVPNSSRTLLEPIIIEKGDPDHKHELIKISWNHWKFGPDVTNIDPKKNYLRRATFHIMMKCSCGRIEDHAFQALIQ
jgi:hypothetical protein